MLKKLIARLLPAAALISGSAEASIADRVPTSPWQVEFADNACLISRNFGTAASPYLVAIRKMPMANEAFLMVVWDGKLRVAHWTLGHLRFGTGDATAEVKVSAFPLATPNLRRLKMPITDDQLELARKAGRIGIEVPRELDDAFKLPGLSKVLKLGDECAVQLGQAWGFPAEEQARIQSPPKGDLVSVIQNEDYPSEAIAQEEQGDVEARLTVDAKGKPTDCTIIASSGSRSLDRVTCTVAVRRVHYSPAIDIDGKPVRGVLVFQLRWVMP